jgi:hypothetical protein
MVKVNAPALSLDASGKLGGSLVFSKWKGRHYVRSLVTPSNPKSGGQVGMRAMLKFLSQNWAALTAGDQATWEDRADQLIASTFNAYMSLNLFRWRNFTAPTQQDPAAEEDTEAVLGALSATPGVRSVTITQAVTTANDGWGVAFFRSPTGTFETAFDNLIGVGLIVGTANVVLVDSPLDPATYYYDTRPFTLDGILGTETGEQSAVVT